MSALAPVAKPAGRPFQVSRRALLGGAAAAIARPAWAAEASGTDLRRLQDRLYAAVMAASPEFATSSGLDNGEFARARRRLDSRHESNRLRLFGPIVAARQELESLSDDGLDEASKRQLQSLRWLAGATRPFEDFSYGGVDSFNYPVPYVVSQLTGAHQGIPTFLSNKHAIRDGDDLEAYLQRLSQLPEILGDETRRLEADLAGRIVPPDFIIAKAIGQMEARLASAPQQDPLVLRLSSLGSTVEGAADASSRAQGIIEGPVRSALIRQLSVMKRALGRAGPAAGCSRLPEGGDYYRHCLAFHTNGSDGPDAVHRAGLDEVARLSGELVPLLRKLGIDEATPGHGLRALGARTEYSYADNDEGRRALIAEATQSVERVRALLPRYFSVVPTSPFEVRRISPLIEKGATLAYAQPPMAPGDTGVFFINLTTTKSWPRWALASTAFHETFPGHLLQAELQSRQGAIHPLNRALNYTAYSEGWGLYAEQLVDEAGYYEARSVERVGCLQASIWRAARLVVDTGLHWHGWSRERGRQYMRETAGLPDASIESEVDRYCVWPGQACSYKMGQLSINALRDRAQHALGGSFDLVRFHDFVLGRGERPVAVMSGEIDDWLGDMRRRPA